MLAIVAQLQRGAEPKANQDLTILVPPYDPAHIFSLSYEQDETDVQADRCAAPACCLLAALNVDHPAL